LRTVTPRTQPLTTWLRCSPLKPRSCAYNVQSRSWIRAAGAA
jgi:hypothetical protein